MLRKLHALSRPGISEDPGSHHYDHVVGELVSSPWSGGAAAALLALLAEF